MEEDTTIIRGMDLRIGAEEILGAGVEAGKGEMRAKRPGRDTKVRRRT
jgi:hypothetical protein